MNKVFGIIAIGALVACGHAAPKGPESRPRPPLEIQYPALAWVPADASYVVTGQVKDIALTLRELLQPISMLPVPGPAEIEGALYGLFGLNPLSDRDLAAAGIAIDQSVAVFSTGVWPTFAVPVEDGAALAAHLDKHWPRTGVRMREQAGVEIVSWDSAAGFVLSYARVGDWLLMRVAAPGSEASVGAWLDAARATFTHGGIPAHEDLVGTARRARERLAARGADVVPGMLGLARVGKIIDSAAAAGECAGVISRTVDLGYRATAGLYADLGIDLRWLDSVFVGAGCPAPGSWLGDITRVLARFDARTVHLAIRQLSLDERKVQAAAHVGLRSRAGIERQVLDNIPGRSLLERKTTIGGQVVRVIDLGILPRIGYQLANDRGVVAIGSETIEQVYGGTSEAAKGILLAAMGARPERMPDMASALGVILEQMGYPAGLASRFVNQVLSRYADTGFSLTLVGRSIELRGWYELAP